MENKQDSIIVGVRMTRADRERVRAAAERVGQGLSPYIRLKALEAANLAAPRDTKEKP